MYMMIALFVSKYIFLCSGVRERIEELQEKNCRVPETEGCRDCTSKSIAKTYRPTSRHQLANDLRDDLW